MTDQSRRGTVARAIELRADGLFAYRDSHHGIDPQTWQQIAKAAIDANDAWLKGRGWKAVPREADGKMSEIGWEYWSSCEVTWAAMYDAAPSPEEPDK